MSGEYSLAQQSWSKWLIALLIGFPTIGCAYYYYSSKSGKTKKKEEVAPQSGDALKQELPKNNHSTVTTANGPLDQALHLKEHGNKFYKEGKYKEAVKCYSEAIDLCPVTEKDNLSALYQNRAAAYDALSNLDEVIKNCTEAIKLKPTYLKALNRRYKACEKKGQLWQALEDITSCCYLQRFSNEDDISTADRILKKYGQEEAKKYVKNKPTVMPSKEFINHYLASFANDPLKDFLSEVDDTENNLNGICLAKKALKLGNYEDVLKGCTEEINLVRETSAPPSRKYYEALLLRGMMNVLINESVRAKADLDNVIDSPDADVTLVVSALLKRASLHMQSVDIDEAFEDFDRAEKLLPNNSDIYHLKAQMLLLSEKTEEAILEFEKAHSLSPDFTLIQIQKYFTEFKINIEKQDKKKANAAKLALKQIVHDHPDLVEGHLLLAQIYNELQEFEASEVLMNTAISSDPTNSSILVHRGLLYLQWKGDVEGAVKEMQKAIEIDPKCGFAYETLASVEVQRGNILTAISLFDKALPLTKTMKEAAHILSLKIAAQTQHSVSNKIGSFLMM
ncbi:mitochondrial import receptor subunit TOM70 [Cimex lectularius]|uniref:Mitochondrial import receptor subunit TOM70 n=1 Tax=Cimex lectularius TaxID=79782 RepID=A0A8I6S8E8_CIMLE|nr:mitochondrial import receptor subunit TOM70 [Cimex lectularius]